MSGRGVDPRRPPVVWEAWTDDGLGGLRAGLRRHRRSQQAGRRDPPRTAEPPDVDHRQGAGGLAALPTGPGPARPAHLHRVTDGDQHRRQTIGGTAPMVNAEAVHGETVGRSDGTPGQRFSLRGDRWSPSDSPLTCVVIVGEEEQTWTEVPHFAQSLADRSPLPDRRLRRPGAVRAGDPRPPSGALINYGAVPPRRRDDPAVDTYRTGGGQAGNVARGQVRVLKTSVPYVSRVENRSPADRRRRSRRPWTTPRPEDRCCCAPVGGR